MACLRASLPVAFVFSLLVVPLLLGKTPAASLVLQSVPENKGASVPIPTHVASAQPAPVPLSAKEVREAQLAADTEKLYELARQLKVEMDKSTKDTLSLTVIKKAAEIEKLAHSISERMKSN